MAGKVTLQDIIATLPTLSLIELETVRSHLVIATSFKGTITSNPPATQDWLYEGILANLRERGLLRTTDRPDPKRLVPRYPSTSREAWDILTASINPPLTGAESAALGKVAADSLASLLEYQRIPISFKAMLLNVGRVVTAIDETFPGYLASGVISALVRQSQLNV